MQNSWQNILISPTKSMQDTISIIDKGLLKTALVVDEKNKLIGVVTDGDIRRALLKHLPMSTEINKVMNKEPTVSQSDASKAHLLFLMKKNGLLSIPILDGEVVVGLQTIQGLVSEKAHVNNPVFIMAGGFGSRLSPLTDNCPKPLLKVGGKPILENILESFIACGFHQFYISTHYMSKSIKDYFGNGSNWGVNIFYVHEKNPLGTAGGLGLLPDTLPDLPIIMINGDVLTKIDFIQLLKYHEDNQPVCTMCVRQEQYKIPYGVVESVDKKIVSLVEKPTYKYFINAGVYVISREMLSSIKKNVRVDMTDLIEKRLNNNEFVAMFPVHEYWLDIGQKVDFYQAQKDMMGGGYFEL